VNLSDYLNNAPKKAKKKAVKSKGEKPKEMRPIEKLVPVAPIIKVIEQPNYSPEIIKQSANVGKMAEQAIASMRDTVNNNQAVMGEIVSRLSIKPIEFIIQRDNKGDMSKIIPVYK